MRVPLIGPETQAAIAARLDRHLFGKAKVLAKDSSNGGNHAPIGSGVGGSESGVNARGWRPSSSKDVGSRPKIACLPPPEAPATSSPQEPALSPLCQDCAWMSEEGGGYCATHRRGCEGCGRNAVELHEGDFSRTKLARDGGPIMELWCMDCDAITEDVIPVGERYADGQPDSWDLASEELNETASLPRETPAFYGRDRGDWDEHDDKSDIMPHTRTTR